MFILQYVSRARSPSGAAARPSTVLETRPRCAPPHLTVPRWCSTLVCSLLLSLSASLPFRGYRGYTIGRGGDLTTKGGWALPQRSSLTSFRCTPAQTCTKKLQMNRSYQLRGLNLDLRQQRRVIVEHGTHVSVAPPVLKAAGCWSIPV